MQYVDFKEGFVLDVDGHGSNGCRVIDFDVANVWSAVFDLIEFQLQHAHLVHDMRQLPSSQHPPDVVGLLEGRRIHIQYQLEVVQLVMGIGTADGRRVLGGENIFRLEKAHHPGEVRQGIFVIVAVDAKEQIQMDVYRWIPVLCLIRGEILSPGGNIFQAALLFHADHGEDHLVGNGRISSQPRIQGGNVGNLNFVIIHPTVQLANGVQMAVQFGGNELEGLVNHFGLV